MYFNSTPQYMICTLEMSTYVRTYRTCSVRTSKGTQNYLRYLLAGLILCTLGIHRERVRSTYFTGSMALY